MVDIRFPFVLLRPAGASAGFFSARVRQLQAGGFLLQPDRPGFGRDGEEELHRVEPEGERAVR